MATQPELSAMSRRRLAAGQGAALVATGWGVLEPQQSGVGAGPGEGEGTAVTKGCLQTSSSLRDWSNKAQRIHTTGYYVKISVAENHLLSQKDAHEILRGRKQVTEGGT